MSRTRETAEIEPTILDKKNGTANPHPPTPPPLQLKDEGARRAKTRHFPILDLGGWGGGSRFSFYFVQDCSSPALLNFLNISRSGIRLFLVPLYHLEMDTYYHFSTKTC